MSPQQWWTGSRKVVINSRSSEAHDASPAVADCEPSATFGMSSGFSGVAAPMVLLQITFLHVHHAQHYS